MAPGARGARPVVSPSTHSTSRSPARESLSLPQKTGRTHRSLAVTVRTGRDARSAATAPGVTEPHGHTFLKRFSSGLGQTPCLSPLKLVKAGNVPLSLEGPSCALNQAPEVTVMENTGDNRHD